MAQAALGDGLEWDLEAWETDWGQKWMADKVFLETSHDVPISTQPYRT